MGQANILNKNELVEKIFIKKIGSNHTNAKIKVITNSKSKEYKLPIISLKNNHGPTVLLLGANHGDETEGFISLLKLIKNIKLSEISGHLIIIPALNLPALISGKRVSEIDNIDMNRSFYKNTNHNLTFVIANFLRKKILPNVDIILDFHSGGSKRKFSDMAKYYHYNDKFLMEKSFKIALSFRAPICLKHVEKKPHGMLDVLAVKLNKIYVSTELGGGGLANKQSILIADNGINNVLKFLKIIKRDLKYITRIKTNRSKIIMLNEEKKNFIKSNSNGIFESNINLNKKIRKKDLIGTIHFPNNTKRKSIKIFSKISGIVIGITNNSYIKKGEFLALIGVLKDKNYEKK